MKKNEHNCPNKFALRLKYLRKLVNVSQEELANYCGVKRQQISNYEVGLSKPSLMVAEKIADFFCVSLDYLLCRLVENGEKTDAEFE